LLSASHLTRRFGDRVAVDDVSFELAPGEIFALLGPNGAGKTTTLRMLAGLIAPSSGSVERRGAVGFLPETPGLWERLTVRQNLLVYARLHGLPDPPRAIDEGLAAFGLRDRGGDIAAELSKGLKQRVALAKALVNDPELLFLDEPTLGLDPDVAARVRAHIARLRREQGITIVLTTHYMREADELCDEIAFIKSGQILARGTSGELKRQIRLGEVIAFRLDPARVPWLAEIPGVLRCVEVDGWVECTVDEAEKRLPELLRALHAEGVVIRNVQVREPELEEVFVELAK